MSGTMVTDEILFGDKSVCLSDIESVRTVEPEEEAASVATDAYIRENRSSLLRLKLVFVVLILAIAGSAGFCAYYFASQREKDAFHQAFQVDAHSLISQYNESMLTSRLNAMALTYDFTTATSKVEGDSWPFVTLHEFESLTFSRLSQSASDMAFLAPVVPREKRETWETWAASQHRSVENISSTNRSIADGIYRLDDDGIPQEDFDSLVDYSPVWHVSPKSSEEDYLMFDQASDNFLGVAFKLMMNSKSPSASQIYLSDAGQPHFTVFTPVFDSPSSRNVVASISLLTNVASMLTTKLSRDKNATISVVLDSTCGQQHTFHVFTAESSGNACLMGVDYIGEGDQHDPSYNEQEVRFSPSEQEDIWRALLSEAPSEFTNLIDSPSNDIFDQNSQYCGFDLRVYPTVLYESSVSTSYPGRLAVTTSVAILVSTFLFLAYNVVAERLQTRVLTQTKRKSEINGALVKSFFPSVVRERVVHSSNIFRRSSEHSGILSASRRNKKLGPIAEQFPYSTVMFADIAGFTAWSSQRDPEAVFALLESVFEKFDTLARRLGVFKVETIGDCYMAVCGLPNQNQDHAVVAARFAYECISAMREITRELEVQLGPGTASLGLRVGLHSGTVTGGVLRGEKARFQLFGDTVNTAARMESTGTPGRVQASQATANLIIQAGKRHWLTPRKQLVVAKGKGEMQTYFIKPRRLGKFRTGKKTLGWGGDDEFGSEEFKEDIDMSLCSMSATTLTTSLLLDRDVRLIDWNSELLLHCLLNSQDAQYQIGASTYGKLYGAYQAKIRPQIRALICYLSTLFTDKPYHNFEHASVSAMFANRLMKQAVQELPSEYQDNPKYEALIPVLRFAVVLAALVRDIQCGGQRDCKGLDEMASMILAIVKNPEYDVLYFALCNTMIDDRTFSYVLSESIKSSALLVSDESSSYASSSTDDAMLLPKQILNIVKLVSMSSAVGHWMQHWSTFSVWHGRLLQEVQVSCCGCESLQQQPQNWCTDEATFFEHTIIPLANELVSNNLGLDYVTRAQENYREWQAHGNQISATLTMQRSCQRVGLASCDCGCPEELDDNNSVDSQAISLS